MGTAMIDLHVGEEEVYFRVYEDTLCNKIPYFDKMFWNGFAETIFKSADFLEDFAESFDLLLHWV